VSEAYRLGQKHWRVRAQRKEQDHSWLGIVVAWVAMTVWVSVVNSADVWILFLLLSVLFGVLCWLTVSS